MYEILNKIFLEDNIVSSEKEYFFFHKDRFAKILDFIIKEKNKEIRILEMGCGASFLLRGCYHLGYKNIFGVDNYNIFQNLLLKEKYNIIFTYYDAAKEKVPFPDKSFNLIIFSEVLEHFNFYPLAVFKEQ